MITSVPNTQPTVNYPPRDYSLIYTTGKLWSYPETNNGCTGVSCVVIGTELFTASQWPSDEIFVYRFVGNASTEQYMSLYLGEAGSEEEGINSISIAQCTVNGASYSLFRTQFPVGRPFRVPPATRGQAYSADTIRMAYAYGPLRRAPFITHNPSSVARLGYIQDLICNNTETPSVTITTSSTQYAFTSPGTEIVTTLGSDLLVTAAQIVTSRVMGTGAQSFSGTIELCTGASGAETGYVRIPFGNYMYNTDSSGTVSNTQQWLFPIAYKFPSGARLSARIATNTTVQWDVTIYLTGYYL
jgi:hypothetical protein